MPLTYSIAYGLIGSIGSWVLINGADKVLDKCFKKAEGTSEVPSELGEKHEAQI